MNKLKRLLPALLLAIVAFAAMFAVACSKATYTVSFESNGGTTVASQSVEEGKTATEPTAPTYTGYTFEGWYSQGEKYDFSTAVNSNVTLVAQWSINSYTVSFDSDGGSSVASQTINYGYTATQPASPTKTGYTFAGWYNGSTEYDFSTAVTSNVTLTAQWTLNGHTVTFYTNGGNAVESQTVGYNTAATQPESPTKTGYTFAGWYLDGAAYDFTAEVTSDITLEAQWTINSYTVTFDANGGSEVASQTIDYGYTATQPESPELTGYTFAGWYNGTDKYDFSAAVTADITLTAQWTLNGHTVTFYTNGGSAVESQTVGYNTAATQPESPTKTGYTFAGWYLDGAEYDFTAEVTSDITLEAQWIINSYTVTFNTNGGTEVEDQSVNYGYTATQPQTTYKLHTLVGWYLDGEAYDFSTPVTADISLKAKWSIEDSNTLMLTDITIDTSSMTTAYNVGDKLSTSGLSLTLSISSTEGDITALVVSMTIDGTEYIFDDVTIAGELTIDSSEYDNTAAGTYTIYVGYTLNGITRWASYDVTVTSVISGTHGIELEKTTTEYTLVETGKEASVIDLTDITVYSVNDDGTLGTAITEGISYKYYEGATEIKAADITNGKVTNYQVWAYVDYTVGNETYVMSDFVLITIIGDEITALEWADGTNSQAQSLTDSMSATWTLNATYSLTGDTVIDLSKCTVGTAAGQYTVDIKTTVTGSYTAVVTYYYQLGNDVIPATCEVEYKITESTVVEAYSVLIDVNVGTDDVADSTGVTDVISAGLSDGDVIVENLVYTYGSLSTNTENKAGANGEDKLYGRVQFSTAKGITVYLGGAATVTLYARYGSSSGDGAAFVVKDSEGNTVVTSDLVSNKSAYETVTLTIESAGIYTIVASTGSLNTFRIAISGTVGTAETAVYKTISYSANSLTADDVNNKIEASVKLDDTFTLLADSTNTVAINALDETSAVTIEGVTFNYQISLGGSKKTNEGADVRCISFTVTEDMLANGNVTLTVYANHGGGAGTDRTLGLYATGKSSSSYLYSGDVDGAGEVVTIEIDKAGTYYMGSKSSGINIYSIELKYEILTQEVALAYSANSLTADDVNNKIEASVKLDDTFTLLADSTNTVAINALDETSAVTIEGVTFNYQISLGGSKKTNEGADVRCISFTVTEAMLANGNVTLTVYANHGGGAGTDRTLGLYATGKSSSNYLYSGDVDGAGEVVTIEIDAAGTYYMGSKSSGINIYSIELAYAIEVKNNTLSYSANSLTADDVSNKIEASVKLDDTFTLLADSTNTVAINALDETSAVTIEGVTFNYQISLGGSKKTNEGADVRCISFTVTEAMVACGSATLVVYANHGGGAGTDRTLGLYATGKSSSSYLYSGDVDGAGEVVTIEIDAAGTYYMGSKSSGINIYSIALSYLTEVA